MTGQERTLPAEHQNTIKYIKAKKIKEAFQVLNLPGITSQGC
jgi:hypothetical protein